MYVPDPFSETDRHALAAFIARHPFATLTAAGKETGEQGMSGMVRTGLRYLFAGFFTLAGANHFYKPEWYLKIMPPALPYPLLLVYLSGLLETALGVALLSKKRRGKAGWGLAALLLAIFPANLYMTVRPEAFPAFKPWVLWARLPLQFVLIGLVLWSSRAKPSLSGSRR